jgi:hypothetical protein
MQGQVPLACVPSATIARLEAVQMSTWANTAHLYIRIPVALGLTFPAEDTGHERAQWP